MELGKPLNTGNLLSMNDLSPSDIELILDNAKSMKGVSAREIKKVPALRGKTVINFFFEPSTRTRTSFEIAGKRLSADVVNISASSSSITKGENLKDTVLNIQAMSPDALVIRHSAPGSALFVSEFMDCPVINAGDGAHEHPTQALLDLFTIREKKRRLKGLKVTIVGDIRHSRVARSNIIGMTKMGMDVTVCGPKTLIPAGIEKMGTVAETDIDKALSGADVIMVLRLQSERQEGSYLPSLREYSMLFGINERRLELAKNNVLIMHPGPVNRGVEISGEIADGPYSFILNQVTNGVAVRMAVLHLLAGSGH